MARKTDISLEESMEWILKHPNATNQDVPTALRDCWIYNDNDDSPPPGPQLAVFTFGLCSRKLAGTEGRKLHIPATEVLELFDLWQMKLGLAELNEKTDLKSSPLPLYDFPAGEKIEFWNS